MKVKRNTLSNQINQINCGIQLNKRGAHSLNYEKVIQGQQDLIKILQRQVTYLRQYMIYVADFEDTGVKEEDKNEDTESTELTNSNSVSTEKTTKKINGLKGLISEIMSIVEAKSPDEILPQLKKMEEKANRKIEPVFIERVKEKQVPVIVQKIKEVQKPITVQVIKEVEKIVEVPVFKEKVVEKYINKPGENSFCSENGFMSPRHGGNKKNNYFQNKSTKWIERGDYDDTKYFKKSDKTLKYKERERY